MRNYKCDNCKDNTDKDLGLIGGAASREVSTGMIVGYSTPITLEICLEVFGTPANVDLCPKCLKTILEELI